MTVQTPFYNAPPERLADLVGYHLQRSAAMDGHGVKAALTSCGLRRLHMNVLLGVVETPGTSSASLCRSLQMQRANIVSILGDLEKQALIFRTGAPDDNRIQRLFATPEGEAKARRMLGLVSAHEARMMYGLTPAEQTELRRMLALIWNKGANP